MESTAVSSLIWVPRGYPASNPKCRAHFSMTDDEIQEYINKMGIDSLVNDDIRQDRNTPYGSNFFHVIENELSISEKDPYILHDKVLNDSDDEDAIEVRPDDSLIVSTVIEDDTASLQVYLYSIDDGSFYIHHDILIGGYPLCMDWLYDPMKCDESKNIVAVGSFENEIKLWDLDSIDSLEPVSILGKTPKKRGNSSGHKGAVMCLHAHPQNSTILGSGSADETVRVWDIVENKSIGCYKKCKNKVQCIEWHPKERNILFSADFDRSLHIWDVRSTERDSVLLHYDKQFGEPESMTIPNYSGSEYIVIISTENGSIIGFDTRMILNCADKGRTFCSQGSINNKPITGICTTNVKNMLVSCDISGVAKIWNLTDMTNFVAEKQLKNGGLFTCKSCPDESALVAFGGESVALWNIGQEELIATTFGFGLE
ncbi:hypothetical protein ACR3K2_14410 [Cryptosporidium serpentis]